MGFNFFGMGKQPEQATPATAQPSVPATAPEGGAAPATGTPTTGGEATASTLDKFKDLWQTDPNADSKQEPLFAVDQSKLMEAAGKLDFTKVIKPEQLQSIARGGDEAVNAFAQAMNQVAQATFANALSASSKLIEQAMAKKEIEFEAKIPTAIKNYSLDSAISDNPVFKHPAARPVVGAIARAMSAKFPEASNAELQTMASELLAEMAGTQKQKQEAPDQAAGSFDWDSWIKQ